ncbi:AGAP011545-PA, partial [Anopheles gambiae str. PEST]
KAMTEAQANEYLRHRLWQKAKDIYDSIVGASGSDQPASGRRHSKEQVIACLYGRTECCLELRQYDQVTQDCHRLLKLLALAENAAATAPAAARTRLIHSLFKQRKFAEADVILQEWATGQGANQDIGRYLDRLRVLLQQASASGGAPDGGENHPPSGEASSLNDEYEQIETKLEKLILNNLPPDRYTKQLGRIESQLRVGNGDAAGEPVSAEADEASHQQRAAGPGQKRGTLPMDKLNSITCVYCTLSFADRSELRAHCQTESHQNIIMSDEGRDWKWRPPPRGFVAESYTLCEKYQDNQNCHYGNQCVEAHGVDELNEWKERFEYRKKKLQRARDKELYGKSYTEQLLERWVQAPSPEKVMREKVEGVEDSCSHDLVTTISSKVSKREWSFVLKTKRYLKAVALLQDAHRNHFVLKQVCPGEPRGTPGSGPSGGGGGKKSMLGGGKGGGPSSEADLNSEQEWMAPATPGLDKGEAAPAVLEHRIKVGFSTEIYGTFRQTVVFDFGREPVLVKHICVDVVPVTEVDKIQEIKKDIVMSTAERWDETNSEICEFTTAPIPHMHTPAYTADAEREKDLLLRYPLPKASTFVLTQSTITEKRLTRNNYRNRIHELLYVEEIARYEQIARYNLTTRLSIVTNYLLTPSGMATSTAKYSHSGELFALMKLGKDVSEDTSAGRLILNNCQAVYIAAARETTPAGERRKVYEAVIEDKGKNMIYLKVSAKAVTGLGLKPDTEFLADIQFQPNRLTYCEWHQAIDKIADFRIIFPEIFLEPSIPWTPQRQWDASLDPKLNSKQKEAVVAITTPVSVPLPPILLIGPFGTGKTYTLAQAIKQLLLQDGTKILICTHSNSAADLYIKDYLHPWVEEGMTEARPLRVYYHKRWVATVNSIVQKYCLVDLNINMRNFRRPTVKDILKHRIVVVTLNISMELASLDLPKGHFTHIFLDEAAQAMECEAIMPLALAGERTRIILLCENYRAHDAIIRFTSELFYEQKLIASGKQPRHEKFYPLTFFTTRGEDVQDKNSTAFYNNSEVYEVVERVCELRKKWPSAWGKINDQSIGIMTPYADQVFRIRSELRKRRMGGISVERVANVQGKQFRAIFLSTVRTRRTCNANASEGAGTSSEEVDYGFLSNSKLLNTAITRAQSLVAVVGDPVALCSIGRCRKVWERFIEICYQNKSLFGITWSLLRSQLDGVELKKTYVLNPLAPEFVPRALQGEAYLRDQAANLGGALTLSAGGPFHPHGGAGHHGGPPVGAHHHAAAPQQSGGAGSSFHHGTVGGGAGGASFPLGGVAAGGTGAVPPHPAALGGPPIPPNMAPPPPNQSVPNLWGATGAGGAFPMVSSPGGRNTPPGWRLAQKNVPPSIRPQLTAVAAAAAAAAAAVASGQTVAHPLGLGLPNRPGPPPLIAPPMRSPTIAGGQAPPPLGPLPYFQQQQQPNKGPAGVVAAAAALMQTQAQQQQQAGGGAFGAGLYHQAPHLAGGPLQQGPVVAQPNHHIRPMLAGGPISPSGFQQQQQQPPQAIPNSQSQGHYAQTGDLYMTSIQSDFIDMALQTKEFQYYWFTKLMESKGLEAANKFTDILRQV